MAMSRVSTLLLMGLGFATLTLTGCAATIETQSLRSDALEPGATPIQGIVHFQPALMKLTYQFSVRVDDKGKVLGTADAGTCQPVIQKEELQVLPDFSKPMALVNRPATFANSKFSATLNNAMLQSVNSETTSIAADLLKATVAVAEVAVAAMAGPEGNACNAGPRVTKVERVVVAGP